MSQVSAMGLHAIRLRDKDRGYPILCHTENGLAFSDTIDVRGCWSHVVKVRNFRDIMCRDWASWEPVSHCDMYLV